METADRMILETIDEALSILGSKAKDVIYYYVEREFGLSKEQIPSNMKMLHEALRLIFGAAPLLLKNTSVTVWKESLKSLCLLDRTSTLQNSQIRLDHYPKAELVS